MNREALKRDRGRKLVYDITFHPFFSHRNEWPDVQPTFINTSQSNKQLMDCIDKWYSWTYGNNNCIHQTSNKLLSYSVAGSRSLNDSGTKIERTIRWRHQSYIFKYIENLRVMIEDYIFNLLTFLGSKISP